MIPEELFKRRRNHNNTPESVLLIIANFIVVFGSMALFTNKQHINSFFWVAIGLLGLYNFFTIRRNREEFTKPNIIAYVFFSLVILCLLFFFLMKGKS